MDEPEQQSGGDDAGPSTIRSPADGSPPHCGQRPEQGGTKRRRPPRWVVPFLRALERTGKVRAAAVDAGVDHTTAYQRRKAHADFGEAWERALVRFRDARMSAEEEAISPFDASVAHPSPGSPSASPSSPPRGEELTSDGIRMKRVGTERWGKRKEQAFLEELVRSANVTLAAEAAGISTSALYPRRHRDARFAAAWDAAIQTAKARVQPYLVEAATRTFDPASLPVGGDGPTVTVAEAIRIAKLKSPAVESGGAARASGDPWGDGWEKDEAEHLEAAQRIRDRLDRLQERMRTEQEERGWAYCAEEDVFVPPGWRRPDQMRVADGGPRGLADKHCPHCGGGLTVVLADAG